MTVEGHLYFDAIYRTCPVLIVFLTWLLVKHGLQPTRRMARQ